MAKYAQGYERKNSDTKNLIILFTSIIAVVVLAIVGMIIYNSVLKDNKPSFSKIDSQYVLDDLVKDCEDNGYNSSTGLNAGKSKLLNFTESADLYYIYFYDKDSTDETTINNVLSYYDALENGTVSAKLYVFEVPSSTDKLKAGLGMTSTPQTGMLITIQDNKVVEYKTVTSDGAAKLAELANNK